MDYTKLSISDLKALMDYYNEMTEECENNARLFNKSTEVSRENFQRHWDKAHDFAEKSIEVEEELKRRLI